MWMCASSGHKSIIVTYAYDRSTQHTATTAGADAPKKRRGRPPKDPSSSQSTPDPKAKRGPGRPRKQQPEQEPAAAAAAAGAAAAAPTRSPPPSYDAAVPPPLGPSAASSGSFLKSDDGGFVGGGGAGGGGVRWALALVAVALFPKAVAGTLRKLTGGAGGAGVEAAGAVRRNRFLAGGFIAASQSVLA